MGARYRRRPRPRQEQISVVRSARIRETLRPNVRAARWLARDCTTCTLQASIALERRSLENAGLIWFAANYSTDGWSAMNCDVCLAEVLAVPTRAWQDLQVCTACHRALSRAVLVGVQQGRMAITCRDCEQVVSGDAMTCPHCEGELANRPDGWPRLPQDVLETLAETEAARLRETEEELIASSKPELAALLANAHAKQAYDDAYDRLRDELSRLRLARQATPIQSTGAFSEAYEQALIRSSEAIVSFKLDFVTRYVWARWPGQETSEDRGETAQTPAPAPSERSRAWLSPSSRAALRRFAPFVAAGSLILLVAVVVGRWLAGPPVVAPRAPAPQIAKQEPRPAEEPGAPSRRSVQEQQIKDLQAELARLKHEAAQAKAQAAAREPAKAQATDEPRTVAYVLDQTNAMSQPRAPGSGADSDADARHPFEAAKADVLDAISRLDEAERYCIVAFGDSHLEQFPSIGSELATADSKERAASFLQGLRPDEGPQGTSEAHPYSALVHAMYRNPHEMYVHAGACGSPPRASLSRLELESLLLHNRNRNGAPIHFRIYGDAGSTEPAAWITTLCDQTSGTHQHCHVR